MLCPSIHSHTVAPLWSVWLNGVKLCSCQGQKELVLRITGSQSLCWFCRATVVWLSYLSWRLMQSSESVDRWSNPACSLHINLTVSVCVHVRASASVYCTVCRSEDEWSPVIAVVFNIYTINKVKGLWCIICDLRVYLGVDIYFPDQYFMVLHKKVLLENGCWSY